MIGRTHKVWWTNTAAALSAALTLAISGCANKAEPEAFDLSGVPNCQAVWVVGKTLPQEYDGCVGDDGHLVMSGLSYCADGTQFTTHENRFFAQLGDTIGAGPEGSPGADASYNRFWSRCQKNPARTVDDDPASGKRPKQLSARQDFQTFAGDIFTVTLVDTKPAAAKVQFCATAPYQGGSIPVTRSPWGLQDQHGTVWPADGDDVSLRGNTYPVEATVSVGDCLSGWVGFDVSASTSPMRVVYDSSIGGPFAWDVASSGPKTLPDPPTSQPLPTEPPGYSSPQRDCYTLESAASRFSGNWLTLETRGQFTDEAIRLQDRLNWMGYGCIPEDGDYGPVTREAVMRFQRDFGLVVDGKVGSQTWETLFTYH